MPAGGLLSINEFSADVLIYVNLRAGYPTFAHIDLHVRGIVSTDFAGL